MEKPSFQELVVSALSTGEALLDFVEHSEGCSADSWCNCGLRHAREQWVKASAAVEDHPDYRIC